MNSNYAITNDSASITGDAITPQDNGSSFVFDSTDYIGAVKPDETPWYAEWVIPGSL